MFNSAVLATWLCPNTCVIAAVAVEVGAAYNQKVQELGRRHKLGSPHVHIVVGVFAALGKEAALPQAGREFWAGLAAGLQKKEQMAVAQCIPMYKGTTTFAGRASKAGGAVADGYRVPMKIDPLRPWDIEAAALQGVELAAQVRQQYHNAVVALGGAAVEGTAPRGPTERALEGKLRKTAK